MTTLVRIMKGLYLSLVFVPWLVALPLGLPIVLTLAVFSRREWYDYRWAQTLISTYMGLILWLLKVGNLTRELPPEGNLAPGPSVVVANHPGLFDVLYLIRDIPSLTVMVAHKLTRRLPFTPFVTSAGHVRSTGPKESPVRALYDAADRLQRGFPFQLFPEGTRSPEGGMEAFSAGAFRLAQEANVPVQPVFIRQLPPLLTHSDHWFFPPREPTRIQLVYWDPIAPPGKGNERAATKELEKRYRQALQQETTF